MLRKFVQASRLHHGGYDESLWEIIRHTRDGNQAASNARAAQGNGQLGPSRAVEEPKLPA